MYVMYTGKEDKDISNIYFGVLLLTLTTIYVQVNHIFYDDTLQMTRSMSVQCASVV